MELWTGMKTQGSFEMGCGKGKSRGESGSGECGISVGDGPCTPCDRGESVVESGEIHEKGEEEMAMNINASLEELKAEFEKVNEQMMELEKSEPADEGSKEYEEWCEKCEALAMHSEEVMTLIDLKMSQGL